MIPVGYLIAITLAELVTAFVSPQMGLVSHAILLLVLPIHAALQVGHRHQKLMVCLSLAPLIRIMSLSLPLDRFPLVYWFIIISFPLFVATFLAARVVGLTRVDIGLTVKSIPVQLLVALTGIPFGVAEYFVLEPQPLINSLSFGEVWLPALILLIGTGFLEELLFRGVLQRVSQETMGWMGIVYTSLVFAVLHIGYRSVADVLLVFIVGFWFGWVVYKTGSLLGVTLSHGLTNIGLYLVVPFLFLKSYELPVATGMAPTQQVDVSYVAAAHSISVFDKGLKVAFLKGTEDCRAWESSSYKWDDSSNRGVSGGVNASGGLGVTRSREC